MSTPLILFIIGFYEAFLAMTYYHAGRVEHRKLCAFLEMIRSATYLFITCSIVFNQNNIWLIGIPYVIGTGFGNYFSWPIRPLLERKLLKIKKKKGRRTKHWWFWNYRNK